MSDSAHQSRTAEGADHSNPLIAQSNCAAQARMNPRQAASNMLLWGFCLNCSGEFAGAAGPFLEAHQRMSSASETGEHIRAVETALANACDHTDRSDEPLVRRTQRGRQLIHRWAQSGVQQRMSDELFAESCRGSR